MNQKKLTVYIVVADYYKDITGSLTNAAVKHLKKINLIMKSSKFLVFTKYLNSLIGN